MTPTKPMTVIVGGNKDTLNSLPTPFSPDTTNCTTVLCTQPLGGLMLPDSYDTLEKTGSSSSTPTDIDTKEFGKLSTSKSLPASSSSLLLSGNHLNISTHSNLNSNKIKLQQQFNLLRQRNQPNSPIYTSTFILPTSCGDNPLERNSYKNANSDINSFSSMDPNTESLLNQNDQHIINNRNISQSSTESRVHILYRSVNDRFWSLAGECILEWLTVFFLLCLASFSDRLEPFHRIAFATDQSISYPHGAQTVPFSHLVICSFFLPIIVILIFGLFRRKSGFRIHNALLGLCLTISFVFFFQQVVKLTVGSLRPDFLDRCQPVIDETSILKKVLKCTGDPKVIKEGRKSFFSGHSALSFGGLTFLSMFLTQELNLNRRPLAPKYFLIILPVVLALVIAISRVDDYWHRWQDITVGAIVGISTSAISFISHCKYDTTVLELLSPDIAAAAAHAVEPVHSRRDSSNF